MTVGARGDPGGVAAESGAGTTAKPDGRQQLLPVDVLLAMAAAVPSMIALAALAGIPAGPVQLAAWCLPLAAGVAVLLSRRFPRIAVLVLTIGIVVGVPAGNDLESGVDSIWGELGSLSPLVAVAVVYFNLGAKSLTWQSVSSMIGSLAVCSLPLGADVPLLMMAVGWWLVGRVLRSRQLVADQLTIRAAELAAERERFVQEQVRLERAKIARELHDVVAHCMTVIVIQARAGRQLLATDPLAAAEAADVIKVVAAEAESDIAALVELMNPEHVVPLSGQVLDDLVARAAATGTTVTARISGAVDDLDPAVAAAAHRVVQEALTNAFRYAPGAAVRIDLRCGRLAHLEVVNAAPSENMVRTLPIGQPPGAGHPSGPIDAAGSALGSLGTGHGLLGMQERVSAVGGQLSWGPAPTGGWSVTAILPHSARPEQKPPAPVQGPAVPTI